MNQIVYETIKNIKGVYKIAIFNKEGDLVDSKGNWQQKEVEKIMSWNKYLSFLSNLHNKGEIEDIQIHLKDKKIIILRCNGQFLILYLKPDIYIFNFLQKIKNILKSQQ